MTGIIGQAPPVKPCRDCLHSPDHDAGMSCLNRCADFIDWARDHQRWRRQQRTTATMPEAGAEAEAGAGDGTGKERVMTKIDELKQALDELAGVQLIDNT